MILIKAKDKLDMLMMGSWVDLESNDQPGVNGVTLLQEEQIEKSVVLDPAFDGQVMSAFDCSTVVSVCGCVEEFFTVLRNSVWVKMQCCFH